MLQLVLVGQPSLHATVHKLVHRELIGEGYPMHRLTALKPDEVPAFVALQHSSADSEAAQLFLPESVEKVATYSHGIPRLILTLCNLAVFKAKLEGRSTVTPDLIDQVAQSAMVDVHTLVDEHTRDAVGSKAEEEPQSDAQDLTRPTSRATTDREETQVSRLENLNKILTSVR